jgi:hypothetical protein
MSATQAVKRQLTGPSTDTCQPDPGLVLSCQLFKECPRTADWLAIVNCPKPQPKPACEPHRQQLVSLLRDNQIDPDATVRFVPI